MPLTFTNTLSGSAKRQHSGPKQLRSGLLLGSAVAGPLVVGLAELRAEAAPAAGTQQHRTGAEMATRASFYGGGHWHAYGTGPGRKPSGKDAARIEAPSAEFLSTRPSREHGERRGRSRARGDTANERNAR